MPRELYSPPRRMGAGPHFGPAVYVHFRIHSSHLTSVWAFDTVFPIP
jgi:hypothetical protein